MYISSYVYKHIYIHTYAVRKIFHPRDGKFSKYIRIASSSMQYVFHMISKNTQQLDFFLQNLKSANILPAYSNSWLDLKFSSLLMILGV